MRVIMTAASCGVECALPGSKVRWVLCCCRHSTKLQEMSRSVPVWALVLNLLPSQSLPKVLTAGKGSVP